MTPSRPHAALPSPPQVHHIIRSCRETLNQRDERGLTALHRAAFLAQYEGYLEIYEYLLARALLISMEDGDEKRDGAGELTARNFRAARRARARTRPSCPTTSTRTCSRAGTRPSTWRWTAPRRAAAAPGVTAGAHGRVA